jgi:hypothetical protein
MALSLDSILDLMSPSSALKFVMVLCIALAFGVIMVLFFPQMPSVYVFNGVYRNASFDFTGPVPKGTVLIQASNCI